MIKLLVLALTIFTSSTIGMAYEEDSSDINDRMKMLKYLLNNERLIYNKGRKVQNEKTVQNIVREYVRQIGDLLENGNTFHEGKGYLKNNKQGKTDVLAYKRLKKRIVHALDAEPISEKTRIAIKSILNYLLPVIENNDCDYNLRTHRVANEPKLIEDDLMFETEDEAKLLNKISKFLGEVSKDIKLLTKNYKRQCKLSAFNQIARLSEHNDVEADSSSEVNPPNQSENKKNLCRKYKICQNELVNFLTEFYQMLNDTVVNALNNYGAMYSRDVATDGSHEQERLLSVVNNVIQRMDPIVLEVFENRTKKLIQNIKYNDWQQLGASEVSDLFEKYLSGTIARMKSITSNEIKMEFQLVKPDMLKQKIIEEDLKSNLKLDLGNLGSTMTEKMCTVFKLCNNTVKRKLIWLNKLRKNDPTHPAHQTHQTPTDLRKTELVRNSITTKAIKYLSDNEVKRSRIDENVLIQNLIAKNPFKKTNNFYNDSNDLEADKFIATRTSYADTKTKMYQITNNSIEIEKANMYILPVNEDQNEISDAPNRTVAIMSYRNNNYI